jgi:DNA end-binding protein Ku
MPLEDYLVLEILRFPHEVRSAGKVNYLDEIGHGKQTKYNNRELKMAEDLIDGMTEHWKPARYKDTYYDDLMKRIQQKFKSGKSHTVTKPEAEEAEEVRPSKVVDMLPLLRKSLEVAGKSRGKAKSARKHRNRHETAG